MNYYPFHIGDFAAHTSHISWEEDIAYRRMLDWYYLNEKALPCESSKIARLVRMPNSIGAIEAVLEEFFTKSDDGWHNKRADEELTAMIAKKEQQSTKDAHEAERMRRFRERRAVMFSALRERNIVPAWDVPMKELQRLYDESCNEPETHLQREQVSSRNEDATAIPTPTPTPTPINSVTNVTGGEPPKPLTPDEIIFGYGLPLLTNAGTADKQARSFLGGLRKEHGDSAVVDKLRECLKAKPLQPLEWLAASLPPKGNSKKHPAAENFAEKDYGQGGRL